MKIWNDKNKAFTLSYDDGIESDVKFLDIINFYGLKCTFNLNSEILGTNDSWSCKNFVVKRLSLTNITELYKGHEIAVHGCRHLSPTELTGTAFENEFYKDMNNLEKIFGIRPVGMAYPYGAYNDYAVNNLSDMGIKYARTVEESENFDLQEDLMRFKPTCHHDNDRVFELLERFLTESVDKPQLFYLWGHTYEFDANNNWNRIEKICEMIASNDHIFFGTNREVLGI